MQIQLTDYNPLPDILELFSLETPTFVTNTAMDRLSVLLAQAGVHCSSQAEVLQCLYTLHDLNVLEVHQATINNTKYLKIGNKLNGKVTQQNS